MPLLCPEAHHAILEFRQLRLGLFFNWSLSQVRFSRVQDLPSGWIEGLVSLEKEGECSSIDIFGAKSRPTGGDLSIVGVFLGTLEVPSIRVFFLTLKPSIGNLCRAVEGLIEVSTSRPADACLLKWVFERCQTNLHIPIDSEEQYAFTFCDARQEWFCKS